MGAVNTSYFKCIGPVCFQISDVNSFTTEPYISTMVNIPTLDNIPINLDMEETGRYIEVTNDAVHTCLCLIEVFAKV